MRPSPYCRLTSPVLSNSPFARAGSQWSLAPRSASRSISSRDSFSRFVCTRADGVVRTEEHGWGTRAEGCPRGGRPVRRFAFSTPSPVPRALRAVADPSTAGPRPTACGDFGRPPCLADDDPGLHRPAPGTASKFPDEAAGAAVSIAAFAWGGPAGGPFSLVLAWLGEPMPCAPCLMPWGGTSPWLLRAMSGCPETAEPAPLWLWLWRR
jgi:hypothetical protein